METPDPHLTAEDLFTLLEPADAADDPTAAAERVERLQQHLSGCPACQAKWRVYAAADTEMREILRTGTQTKDECPPDAKWLAVAGRSFADLPATLVAHAARCARCSALLEASVVQPLDQPLTSGRTSTREWRESFIEQHIQPRPVSRRMWPWWAAAAAALAVALLLWPWLRRPDTDQMLAQAYTARRPFPFRLADRGYARLAGEKGSSTIFELPPDLHRAAEEVQRANPNDPDWQRRKAHVLLLEGSREKALPLLEQLHQGGPDDFEVTLLLAGALFLRGESSAESAGPDLTKALDLLLRLQRARPGDPRVQFNLALVWEALPQLEKAADAWRDFLKLDSTSGYAGEAREHLKKLDEKLAPRARAWNAVSPDPLPYLSLPPAAAPPDAFLEVAVAHWLPLAVDRHAGAQQALYRLAAAIRQTAGDPFLSEINSHLHPGLKDLAQAVALNRNGNPAGGVVAARAAVLALTPVARAAALRARAEEVYGLHRITDGPACLAAARALRDELRGTSYRWLEAFTLTEMAICFSLVGQYSEALSAIAEAVAIAEKHALHTVEARARGMQGDLVGAAGDTRSSWIQIPALLRAYWAHPAPPNHLHQLLFSLRDLTAARSCPYAALALAECGADAIGRTGEKLHAALAWQAVAALAASMPPTSLATRSQRVSQTLFAQAPESPLKHRFQHAATIQQFDGWRAAHAGADASSWIPRLAKADGLRQGVDSQRWRNRLSRLYFDTGDFQRSWQVAQEGLQHTERAIPQPSKEDQAQGFRALMADIILERDHNPRAALAAWYPAPLRSRLTAPLPADLLYLTLADLPSGPTMFARFGTSLEYHRLPSTANALTAAAARLRSLAADPTSDVTRLDQECAQLKRDLFQPVAHQLAVFPDVVIETAPGLGDVPVALLLPGHTTTRPLTLSDLSAPATSHPTGTGFLIAVNPELPPLLRRLYPPQQESLDEAADLEKIYPGARTLSGASVTPAALQALAPSTRWFHFTGHATAGQGSAALLLASSRTGDPWAGLLTADRVIGQNWRQCDLVVLSACATAAGSVAGPESVTLVHAFLHAGARRVAAALWPVQATATRALMRRFHEFLATGTPPARALALARRQVRSQAATRHPYFWAAFQMYGSY